MRVIDRRLPKKERGERGGVCFSRAKLRGDITLGGFL